jgi:hypothetical protein
MELKLHLSTPILINTSLSRLVLLGQDTTSQGVVVGLVSSSSVNRSLVQICYWENLWSTFVPQRCIKKINFLPL